MVQPKTLYKKTVHRQESRGYGDLFVWFGGTVYNSFLGLVICWSLTPPNPSCYWPLQWQNQFPIIFLLLCWPWENTVLFKCRHQLSLAQSSYIMSLGTALCCWVEPPFHCIPLFCTGGKQNNYMDLFGTKNCFRNADGRLWLDIKVCHVVGECNGTRGGMRMGWGGAGGPGRKLGSW
jgi:hypothetical protein